MRMKNEPRIPVLQRPIQHVRIPLYISDPRTLIRMDVDWVMVAPGPTEAQPEKWWKRLLRKFT